MHFQFFFNIGIAALLALQFTLATFAYNVVKQSSENMAVVTGALQPRLEALNKLEHTLQHAFNLYQLDRQKQNISAEEMLSHFQRLDKLLNKAFQDYPTEFSKPSNLIPMLPLIRQTVLRLKIEKERHSDEYYSIDQKLVLSLINFRDALRSVMFTYEHKDKLLNAQLQIAIRDLDLFEQALNNYKRNEPPDQETIHFLLKHASDYLNDFLSYESPHGTKGTPEAEKLVTLLATLQANLPRIYSGMVNDPNISLLDQDIETMGYLWDNILNELAQLKSDAQERIGKEQALLLEKGELYSKNFFQLMAINLLIGIAFALALSFLLRQKLNLFAGGVAKVTRGDLNYRLPIRSKDQIGMIAKEFNLMADTLKVKRIALENSLEQTQKANHKLRLMREVFEHSLEGIIVISTDGSILKANPSFVSLTGFSEDCLTGHNIDLLQPAGEEPGLVQAFERCHHLGLWEGEIWCQRKDNGSFPAQVSISRIQEDKGEDRDFVCLLRDISVRKKQEETIRHQALHDHLTGLPNRALLRNRMEQAIAVAQRDSRSFGVLFLDLDNFKTVNDSLGHDKGDLLLKEVGNRLSQLFRNQDTICRHGGDEFVGMVVNLEEPSQLRALGERILQALQEPVQIDDKLLQIGCSIGAAIYPDNGQDSETLLKHADLAMYAAKEGGKNYVQLFNNEMLQKSQNQ